MKIAQGALLGKQLGCDLDKVIGGLVIEVADDAVVIAGSRSCFSWRSVAELFLSARADAAANSRRRQRGTSCSYVPTRSRVENDVAAETPRAVRISAVQVTKPLNKASSSV
jgi:hypothetical protein